WFLAADRRRVHVNRVLASDKLSLGEWNPVRLNIQNRTGRALRVTIRDLPPVTFGLDRQAAMFTQTLAAQTPDTLEYHVKPPRRGASTFDDLYLRVDGPLGLVQRTFRQRATSAEVRVYPNLRE